MSAYVSKESMVWGKQTKSKFGTKHETDFVWYILTLIYMYIFITTWWKSASAMGQLLKQLCFRLMPDLFCFCFFVRSYFY